MIITCPNCNKQFKIDNSLIPNEGRNLQCGSCDHIWFYKIEDTNKELFQLKEEIIIEDPQIKSGNSNDKIVAEKKQSIEITETSVGEDNNKNISKKQKSVPLSKNTENRLSKFFSLLMVLIISFIALIILLDTIKIPLINTFPGLEIFLFNLFETLQDIKLFIIDLI